MRWPAIPLQDRFYQYVDINSDEECWNWIGGKHERGYGLFHPGIDIPTHRKTVFAHKVSLFIVDGVWDDSHVLHNCDNPRCVNPKHLSRGTHLDNMKDRDIKGRNKPRYKISKEVHTAIKDANKILTNEELACIFEISPSHVSRVRRDLIKSRKG